MLGLTNALVSSSASHRQQYSLLLDGTGDFLNLGNQDLIGAGDFSISVWVKSTDSDIELNYFIAKYQNDDNRWYLTASDANPPTIQFLGRQGGTTHVNATGVTSLDGNQFTFGTWNHFVFTWDRDGNWVHYINGIADNSAAVSNTSDLDNTGDIVIGAYKNDGTSAWPGSMDNVAIFNVALDADAVSAIYNDGRPFDLNKDRGNYDNSSALQGYWKMFDGPFDNKVNGVIHDAHNPGFGAELVTGNNATFDGANDWAAYNPSGTTGISTSGGKLTVTLSGAGDGVDSGVVLEMSSSLTAGKTYKVVFDAWLGTASVNGYRVKLGGTGGSGSDYHITMTSTQTTFTYYIRATDTTDLYIFQTDVDSDTGTFFIDNVSVKELNGFPGITAADATYSADTPDDQTMSHVMRFDGTNDYLSTQADSTLATRTYSFWCRSTKTSDNSGLFSHGAVDHGGFHINPNFNVSNAERPIIYLGASYYQYFLDTPAQDDGNWHHWAVCMKHDDVTNSSVYVDGVALGKSTYNSSGGSADAWSGPLTIGWDGGSRYFEGDIDQFAVFDTLLAEDAIQSLAGQMWDGTDGDDANWTVYGSNTKTEDTGAVKITEGGGTNSDNGAFIYLKDAHDLNADLIIGRRYKLTCEVKVSGGACNVVITSPNISDNLSSSITSTSFVTATIYYTAGTTTGDYLRFEGLDSTESVWIKSISLIDLDARQNDLTQTIGNYDGDWTDNLINYWKMGDGASDEVGDGIVHDQTDSGYGNEIITPSNLKGYTSIPSNWSVANASGDTHKVTWGANGARFYAETTGTIMTLSNSTMTVTSGKIYRLQVVISNYNGTGGVKMDATNLGTTFNMNSNGMHEIYFKATGSGIVSSIYRNGNDVDLVIESVSLKELNGDPGMTASGATMIKQPV